MEATGTISLGANTTSISNIWNIPVRIEVNEVGETIEMIYKQTENLNYYSSYYKNTTLQERVFKIIYSCKDGKWHKSEPIYGKIIQLKNEYYEF